MFLKKKNYKNKRMEPHLGRCYFHKAKAFKNILFFQGHNPQNVKSKSAQSLQSAKMKENRGGWDKEGRGLFVQNNFCNKGKKKGHGNGCSRWLCGRSLP